jgi:hypothetical protein
MKKVLNNDFLKASFFCEIFAIFGFRGSFRTYFLLTLTSVGCFETSGDSGSDLNASSDSMACIEPNGDLHSDIWKESRSSIYWKLEA